MKVDKWVVAALAAASFAFAGCANGMIVAPSSSPSRPATVEQKPSLQRESETPDEAEGTDEVEEVAPGDTPVTAEQAQAVAEEANPGAKTLAVEYDVENGTELFEVELDNGLDVAVDAATGAILQTEIRDAK